MGDRQISDFNKWQTWRDNKNDDSLEALHHQLNPIVMKEVNRWKGTLAPEILEVEARGLAQNAFESYDPKFNVALSTHVSNALKKLSRINYSYQNPARLPEHRQVKFYTFNTVKTNLENELGREPNINELSDELGWNTREVERMNKEIRKDYTESIPVPAHAFMKEEHSDDGMIDFIYNDLSSADKTIFEHTTGYRGKPILSLDELTKKTGLTTSQISYKKSQIKDFIKKRM